MRSEDIAKLAGVSRSTVSRVINNYSNVPEETREKVMKIIEQYSYEPNTSARVLAGKEMNTIGLFIVSIADGESSNRIYQNNYFAPFVEAVVDNANRLGYYVLIHTVYSQDDYLKVKQAFSQKRIDGGILVGTQQNIELVRDLVNLKSPVVLIDYDIAEIMEHRLDHNNLAVINSKDYDGTAEAVRYLISLGHTEIGMIKGRMNTFSGKERYAAFVDTLIENGLELREEFMLEGEFIKQHAYDEMRRLLAGKHVPTAFFSANDDMAIAAMEAIKERGLRVPEDISLIGFDDVPVASQLVPSLTSVRIPIYEMSREAVQRVTAMCMSQASATFGTVGYPTQLVVRQSCQSIHKA